MNENTSMSSAQDALQQESQQLREAFEAAQGASGIYAHIAYALARDYVELFYVNLDTGEFVEYYSDDERGMLLESKRDAGFFESCRQSAQLSVHPDDRGAFVAAMNREYLCAALDQHEEFDMIYRRIKDGRSFYVQMNVSRMKDDGRFVVVAVSDVDELIKKRREEERVQEERIVYARLHAITGNYIVVYVVDPKTDRFREFSSTESFSHDFRIEKEGESFFERSRKETCRYIRLADVGRFLAVFTKENVLAAIERDGIFTLGYVLILGGKPAHVQMKAAMVEEDDGPRIIVGLYDIDTQVRQEKETKRRLAQAQEQVNIDALTGVKNKHAYLEEEDRLNDQIERHQAPQFAVVVLDVNDLKRVNDTDGHQAGDEHIREACRIVCEAFKHSPVYRVGGDEFAVIAQGADYIQLEDRLWDVSVHNEEALHTGGIVIACGVAKYEDDDCVADVFNRADRRMYEDKSSLKSEDRDERG